MKKLEELNVSPAPWKHMGDCIVKDKTYNVIDGDFYGHIVTFAKIEEDARLIAAAPELYECLREAVVELCHNFTCSGSSEDGYACNGERDCFVKKWRKALAKAAGESEVK